MAAGTTARLSSGRPRALKPDAKPIADLARVADDRSKAINGSAALLEALVGAVAKKPRQPQRQRDYIIVAADEPPVHRIQRTVAAFYMIPLAEMWSERRFQKVARPRQVAMYLTKQLTPLSLPSIGRRFGNRDHTTVMYAIEKVEEMIAEDIAFASDVRALQRELSQ